MAITSQLLDCDSCLFQLGGHALTVRGVEVCYCWLQFERTLIIAEDDSEVSYLEGCTAPSYDSNQVCQLYIP